MSSINTVAAKSLDITCYAGDTFRAQLTFTDENDGAIDLTSVDLKMQVRTNNNSTIILTFQESDNSITKLVNVVSLKKNISIKGGNYVYDFQATNSSGDVITYLKGTFSVVQDVTDAKI